MRKSLSIMALSLICFTKVVAQCFIETENGFDSLYTWEVNDIREYQGIYRIGNYHEDNSSLLIIVQDTLVIAQLKSYRMNSGYFIPVYLNLVDATLHTNGTLSSKNFEVKFGSFLHEEGMAVCINGDTTFGEIIKKTPTLAWQYQNNLEGILDGMFSQASVAPLTESKLREYSSEELRLMRNEIFARYGYMFKWNGEMYKHFKEQTWYSPRHSNVNSFLTTIEKINIKAIQTEEGKR